MEKERFIQKWLPHIDRAHSKQFRDEMRDDLGAVIEWHSLPEAQRQIFADSHKASEAGRDFGWIKPNIQAWMQGVVMLPVEVMILYSNSEDKEAFVKTSRQEGWVEWNRLYKSKDECPCR